MNIIPAPGPRIGGHCVCCDQPVYNILTFDAVTGNPKTLGAPIEGAVHALFLQVDGRRVELSFCARCIVDLKVNMLPAIWRRVVLAFCQQRDLKSDIEWTRNHNRAIVDIIANPPIAYIGAKALARGIMV